MKINKNTFEIIFFARGGQGAKTASELVAHSAVSEGKFVKAFPFFGPERSGAPTKMFLRISDEEIKTQEPVLNADLIVVMDETILNGDYAKKSLEKNESLIINSKKTENDIRKMLPESFNGKIYSIDATKIAIDITGNQNPNMVLVGRLINISEIVKLDSVEKIFREIFIDKIGKELTEKNIYAMQKGYDSL